ncbi:MAG: hypothetical protein IMW89_22425 [Ktedonobacteraceae bacterium]|nr:hypothetical protein [Ktedonobacteraceae bacterium]
MSRNSEKYLYFNIGLLKGSFALKELWQDAVKYHMVDNPAQLIALRLTEYYELKAKGLIQVPAALATSAANSTSIPITPGVAGSSHIGEVPPTAPRAKSGEEKKPGARTTGPLNDDRQQAEAEHAQNHSQPTDGGVVAASPDAEHNADEAAQYWPLL